MNINPDKVSTGVFSFKQTPVSKIGIPTESRQKCRDSRGVDYDIAKRYRAKMG